VDIANPIFGRRISADVCVLGVQEIHGVGEVQPWAGVTGARGLFRCVSVGEEYSELVARYRRAFALLGTLIELQRADAGRIPRLEGLGARRYRVLLGQAKSKELFACGTQAHSG
jgi:hypothetical protein